MAAERILISGVAYIGKSGKGERVTIIGYAGNPDLSAEHPIVIPPPPDPFPNPPPENIVVKPPPDEGGWGFASPEPGWYYVPGPGGAGPK